jgi:hypothetical protein
MVIHACSSAQQACKSGVDEVRFTDAGANGSTTAGPG